MTGSSDRPPDEHRPSAQSEGAAGSGADPDEREFRVPDSLTGAAHDLARPQRQSIWAVPFIIGRLLRRIGLANIGIGLVAITSGRVPGGLLAAAMLFALVLAGLSLLAWWRRTFFIKDGELVTMQGIVNLSRVNIPLGRIQSVNIDQQLLHRAVGLVRARVETAGSSGAGFELEALDRRVALALRSAAVAVGSVGAAEPLEDCAAAAAGPSTARLGREEGRQILHRSIADLVRVAIGRSPLADLAVLAPLVAVAFEVFEPAEIAPQAFDAPSWLTLLGLGAVVGVMVVAFGFVSTILRNYRLTLWIEGERLRSTSGLFSTVERSASVDRVQLLSTSQNPVNRHFGMSSVSLATVSGRVGSADAMRLVGTSDAELADLSSVLFVGNDAGAIHHISERAVQRWRLWVGVVPGALVAGIGAPLVGWWAGVALVWVAVVAVAAPQVQRRWMYGIGGEDITVRHGVVTHRVARLAIRKTQAVTIHRGLFHRRYGLATVRIHTAARDVSIPHISVSDAMAIRDRLLFHVESRTQAWM